MNQRPSRIQTLLELFSYQPPAGVGDNQEVGQALFDLANKVRPDDSNNMLEEFANLPGHALANTIDAAGVAVQPEMVVSGLKQLASDPTPAIEGAKDFAKEVAKRPIAVAEQLSISDLVAPGLGVTIPAKGPAFRKMLAALGSPKIRARAAELEPGTNFSSGGQAAANLFFGDIEDAGERAMRSTSLRSPPGKEKGGDASAHLGPTPKQLVEMLKRGEINPNASVLDFGAGIRANAAEGLSRAGFTNVSALDLPENMEIGRFFNALGDPEFVGARHFKSLNELTPQDVVMLQNVLNVQRKPEDLAELLDFAIGRVGDKGKILANFPGTPRRYITDKMTNEKVRGFFDDFPTDRESTDYLMDQFANRGFGKITRLRVPQSTATAPIFIAERNR